MSPVRRAIALSALAWVGALALQASAMASPAAAVKASVSPARVPNGSFLLLRVVLPGTGAQKDGHSLRAEYRGQRIPLYRGTSDLEWLTPIAIDYEHPLGKDRVRVTAGDAEVVAEVPFTVVDGKYPKVRQKLQVDSRFESTAQDAATQARIEKEFLLTREIYARPATEKRWSGNFRWPIGSPLTSRYGVQRLYNGKRKRFHQGLDLRAAVGTPTRAPAAGTVVLAQDLYYSGGTVLIDHGHSLMTQYFHLSRIDVKPGDTVEPGTLLGLSGESGQVTGPHLHWGVVLQGLRIDPAPLTKRLELATPRPDHRKSGS